MKNRAVESVIMNGGQGDVVMAACGLHAMLQLVPEAFAGDLCCYTRSFIVPVIAAMLPECRVVSMDAAKKAGHPRYYTSANTSGSTVLRNLFSSDWYINFAAGRRRASFGNDSLSGGSRMLQWIDNLAVGKSLSWQRTSPLYYGLQMWAPLAAKFGKTEIDLLRSLHLSYAQLRLRLLDYVGNLPPLDGYQARVAIYPVGRSFQTIPAEFLQRLFAGRKDADACCYLPGGDERTPLYQAAGFRCEVVNTPEAMLKSLADAELSIVCDSLPSHLAQLVARETMALMSHDLPQHTLHPAAPVHQVFVAQACVPCQYVNISGPESKCRAGYGHCNVFENPAYLACATRMLGNQVQS